MLRQRVVGFLVLLWVGYALPAVGQFYAPNTEFHDLAQRCFVVEAARVLAWRENVDESKIAQVTFDVETKSNQDTVWKVRWLDARSNMVRQVTVNYPESLLTEGPKFYRTVFGQLWASKWRGVASTPATNSVAEFWKGMNEAGYSRLETLQAAWKYLSSHPKETEPAHLAGMLQGAAIPAIAGAVSLDALLLSRSAAWLCVAEMGLAEPGPMDGCWAPILFLAGRDRDAASLWKKRPEAKRAVSLLGPISDGWSFLLERPGAKAGFVYAAAREHRRFALPIMIYHCGTADLESTLGTAMYGVFAQERAVLLRLHDYSPYLSLGSGVSGGRVGEGILPTLARMTWLQALRAQPLSRLDYTGHTNLIAEAQAGLNAAIRSVGNQSIDASVLGLPATAAIFTEAYKEGLGPLIPTALVSARDLLQYGWESACVNLETRNRFVSQRWGVRELSQSIVSNSISHIKGSSTFFLYPVPRGVDEMITRLQRMQFADNSSFALRQFPLPVWSQETEDQPRLYWRRCWLRPWLIGQQVNGLSANHHQEIVPFLTRFHSEGGAGGDAAALQVLVNNIPANVAAKIPGRQKLKEELAKSLLEPSILQLNTRWEQTYEKMPYFERGQELEKIYWESPDINISSWIFHNYLHAHADTSARRFYRQAADLLRNPILLANGIGQMRYAMAVLDNDRVAMKEALEDSDSGSGGNMRMLLWEATVKNDLAGLRRQADEYAERYPGSATGVRRIKGFIPLLPALAEASHADREKALDYFKDDSEWIFLQWILIQKHKLNETDAIRFLGGTETDEGRQVLVSFLQKDKKLFEERMKKFSYTDGFTTARLVLVRRLQKELLEIEEPEGQVDLKLPNAQTVEQAMMEALAKR